MKTFITIVTLLIFSMCFAQSSSDAMSDSMMDDGMMMSPKVIYATSNPSEVANDAILGLTPELSEAFLTFNSFAPAVTSVQSITFAADGTAYMTIDTADGGSIVGVPDLGNMAESMMMADSPMMMMGGLKAPKGLQVVDELGLVIVADFGGKAIVVYDRDLNMMSSVTDLGGDRSVWDVHHDVMNDTLYAAGTDGVLLLYEGFSSLMGASGPTRTIIPSDAAGNKISVNLHGVSYYAPADALILTDVGDANSAEDGQLFVITNASISKRIKTVSVQIGGPASMLGNPVDIVFDGTYAYVAEKSNDMVLRFDNLLATDMMGMMGDSSPAQMIEVIKAESVALPANSMMGETMMDGGMMSDGMMAESTMDDSMMSDIMMMSPKVIYATANPGEIANDAILGLTPDLSEAFLTFNGFAEAVTSVQSIAFAADGTAYMTVDTADGGSIVGVPDLGNMAESMMMNDSAMMMMANFDGLKAPKGLQVVDDLGLVIVADFGAKAIVVFDRDLNKMGSVTNLGGDRSIWDVYHDVASNTLYAAGTDGVLVAYDGFATTMGADGPSRMIIPSDAQGNKISVNLHGVAYYAPNDELILTDVGDATSAEDGQLFVMTQASASYGNQTVSVQIGGPASMLGNPVDVVFDGTYAYVAEKSNDMVLRFDNLLAMDMMGMMGDSAPSLMIEVTKAESVALPATSMMGN